MYIKEILWLISWPALIIVSYYLIKLALRKFKKNLEEE